jgi:iron complex outermembrane receptor protein
VSAVPATAVYVDGIFEGTGGNYDIDRVEVLRGPQGTLYGRSATAGVVATHTRNPSFDGLGTDVSVEFGNYDLQHYTGALNVPLSETFAVRVAGDFRDQGEGYFGRAEFIRETTSGRIKALWQPREGLSLLLGFALEDNNSQTGGTWLANPQRNLTS